MVKLLLELLAFGFATVTFLVAFVLLVLVNLATRALSRGRRRQERWRDWPGLESVEVELNSHKRSSRGR